MIIFICQKCLFFAFVVSSAFADFCLIFFSHFSNKICRTKYEWLVSSLDINQRSLWINLTSTFIIYNVSTYSSHVFTNPEYTDLTNSPSFLLRSKEHFFILISTFMFSKKVIKFLQILLDFCWRQRKTAKFREIIVASHVALKFCYTAMISDVWRRQLDSNCTKWGQSFLKSHLSKYLIKSLFNRTSWLLFHVFIVTFKIQMQRQNFLTSLCMTIFVQIECTVY